MELKSNWYLYPLIPPVWNLENCWIDEVIKGTTPSGLSLCYTTPDGLWATWDMEINLLNKQAYFWRGVEKILEKVTETWAAQDEMAC